MNKLVKFTGYSLRLLIKIIGGICCIIGFFIAFYYFYIDDHILYLFPNLAQEVTLAELIENQEKYDDKWVRVKGELWHPRTYWATFVPPGTGPESMTAEEINAWYKKRKNGEHLSREDTQKNIPKAHATLYALPRTIRTASLSGIGSGRIVGIAGEFEKAVWYKGKSPIIDVAVMINPRQPMYWLIVILIGLTSLIFILVGIILYFVSRKIGKDLNGVG